MQCRYCRGAQIPIQHAGAAVADDVQWTWYRQCCYRKSTRQRLQQYKSECLGTARQHENIRRRIVPDQCFALLATGKVHLWIAAFHLRQQMAVADDQL